jgi:hypothetical protein
MATPKITVREPRYGAVVLNYGQPGINQCRATVAQHGYHT